MQSLTARAAYGSSFSSRNFNEIGDRISFFDQLGDNKYRRVSLNLSIPIFNKFQTKTDVQIARVNVADGVLANKQAEVDLTNSLQKAYLDFVSAQSSYKAAEENLVARRQAFLFMETSYDSGNTDLYNYLEALNNKNRAEMDLVNSKYSIVLRKRILDIYQGIN